MDDTSKVGLDEEAATAAAGVSASAGGRDQHPSASSTPAEMLGRGPRAAPPGAPHDRGTGNEQAPATTLKIAGATPEIYPDKDTDDLQIVLGEFEGPLD